MFCSYLVDGRPHGLRKKSSQATQSPLLPASRFIPLFPWTYSSFPSFTSSRTLLSLSQIPYTKNQGAHKLSFPAPHISHFWKDLNQKHQYVQKHNLKSSSFNQMHSPFFFSDSLISVTAKFLMQLLQVTFNSSARLQLQQLYFVEKISIKQISDHISRLSILIFLLLFSLLRTGKIPDLTFSA